MAVYVVIFDDLEAFEDSKPREAQTLEQAFAQIMCRCGYAYHFEQEAEGWKLTLTNGERPEHSPEPILSDYIKPRDAKYHLMEQAVDGRLKGHVAVPAENFEGARITRNAGGTRVQFN